MHYNTRYRIVKDTFLGFEVQSWKWWFPFWTECSDGNFTTNTFENMDDAKEFIRIRKRDDMHRVFYKE